MPKYNQTKHQIKLMKPH